MKIVSETHSANVLSLDLSEQLTKNGRTRKIKVRTDHVLTHEEYNLVEGDIKIFCGKYQSNDSLHEYCFEERSDSAQTNRGQRVLSRFDCLYKFADLDVAQSEVGRLFSIRSTRKEHRGRTFRIHILWKAYKSEVWDAGADLFSPAIESFTPKALAQSWPSKYQNLNGWQVEASSLEVNERQWWQLGRAYAKLYDLTGTLVLTSVKLVNNYELWEIDFNEPGVITDVYLDFSSYAAYFPAWKASQGYTKGQYVNYEGTLKRCTADHAPSESMNDEVWENTEDYWNSAENSFYDSEVGKEVLNEIVRNIFFETWLDDPEQVIEARGPWSEWRHLRVGHLILVDSDTFGIVKSISHVFDSDKKYINFTCHFIGRNLDGETIQDVLAKQIEINVLERSNKIDPGFRSVKLVNDFNAQKDQEQIMPTYFEITSNQSYVNQTTIKFQVKNT